MATLKPYTKPIQKPPPDRVEDPKGYDEWLKGQEKLKSFQDAPPKQRSKPIKKEGFIKTTPEKPRDFRTADSGFFEDGTGFGRNKGQKRLPDGTIVPLHSYESQKPQQPPGFNQISPNLGVANIQPQQIDPTTGQPMTPQAMPQPQQQTGNPIQSKIRSLYKPLPTVQQAPMRRVFRILPIKRRTSF